MYNVGKGVKGSRSCRGSVRQGACGATTFRFFFQQDRELLSLLLLLSRSVGGATKSRSGAVGATRVQSCRQLLPVSGTPWSNRLLYVWKCRECVVCGVILFFGLVCSLGTSAPPPSLAMSLVTFNGRELRKAEGRMRREMTCKLRAGCCCSFPLSRRCYEVEKQRDRSDPSAVVLSTFNTLEHPLEQPWLRVHLCTNTGSSSTSAPGKITSITPSPSVRPSVLSLTVSSRAYGLHIGGGHKSPGKWNHTWLQGGVGS